VSASTVPLYGQAWELQVWPRVLTPATPEIGSLAVPASRPVTITSNAFKPEALRMRFEVVQSTIPSPYWFADIDIYNADDQTVQNTLFNATWVSLKAGFQYGAQLYSSIWNGPVLQTTFTREAVVDQRTTLHCVANPLIENQIVNYSMGAYGTQVQMAQRMVDEVNQYGASATQFQVKLSALAQQRAGAVVYPRGNTVFGMPDKYLSILADSQRMQKWLDGNSAYISELDAGQTTPTPDYIYTPPLPIGYNGPPLPANVNASLLDTPRQTPQGVIFRTLLDPRLAVQLPPLTVQILRAVVAQQQVTPGQNYISPLSNNLVFFVGQVCHRGDTRGNEWETEVTGYTTTFASSLLNGPFAVSGGGG
jgi:hypothetical protein